MDAAIPLVEAVFSYLKQHPEELVHVAKNAIGLRFGLPIAALRWLAGKAKGKKAPKDIEISAVPPGVREARAIRMGSSEPGVKSRTLAAIASPPYDAAYESAGGSSLATRARCRLRRVAGSSGSTGSSARICRSR